MVLGQYKAEITFFIKTDYFSHQFVSLLGNAGTNTNYKILKILKCYLFLHQICLYNS